jgi:hypothetical protein
VTRPQFVRDRLGCHLVWGQWMLSHGRWRVMRFGYVRRYSRMGATRLDLWHGLGFILERIRHLD